MKNNNKFQRRIARKSVFELEYMISYPDNFVPEAVKAAQQELKKRAEDGTIDADLKLMASLNQGEGTFRDFISSIQPVPILNIIPQYSEKYNTKIQFLQIYEQAAQACEKLHWDVVFYDHHLIEAKRKKQLAGWAETLKIFIKESGELTVSCIYHNYLYDFGQCSKWVKLFIHVFSLMEKELLKSANN